MTDPTDSDYRDDLGRARVAVWCKFAFALSVAVCIASAVTVAVGG